MRGLPSASGLRRCATALLAVLAAAVSLNMLWCCWCLYVGRQFRLFDYGLYTNFIWNSGRGDFFKCMVNDSYLVNHLSFSLVPLGWLYYLWDDAFLLLAVQWLFPVLGALILVAAGRRHRLPPELLAMLAFFFVGYRFTQQILAAEFHGVALYLLLVPWLYYNLSFRKGMVWLPLLLILGVREDAFLFLQPLLLYFAVKDRWRMGYVWMALSIGYGALAIYGLYPWLNGMSMFARRERDGSLISWEKMIAEGVFPRWGKAVVWTLLPMLVAWRRGSLPAFLFPAVAFVQCVLSGIDRQQSLGIHYSAPVMSMLACGILESFARRQAIPPEGSALGTRALGWRLALWLAILVAGHRYSGYTWGGRVWSEPHISRAAPAGREAREIALKIPKDGVLVADDELLCFVANRADVIDWRNFDPRQHDPLWIFTDAQRLHRREDGRLLQEVRDGLWGVAFVHGPWLVLRRGGDTSGNTDALHYVTDRIYVAGTVHRHGDTVFHQGRALRHWNGNGSRSPCDLSHGSYRVLAAGAYQASFRYRAAQPRRKVRDSWGWFSLHVRGRDDALARAEIARVATPAGAWSTQVLTFAIGEPTEVEARITGADAPLWLDQVQFVPTP